MNVIGRKIYIAWGPNRTLAIEKLVVPPEQFGLSSKLDTQKLTLRCEELLRGK